VQVIVWTKFGDPFKAWVAGSNPAALTSIYAGFRNLSGIRGKVNVPVHRRWVPRSPHSFRVTVCCDLWRFRKIEPLWPLPATGRP
jgi:hypothetical protein